MTAILRKELKGYYTSLFTYVYYALYLLMLGVYFVKNCLTSYSTEFGYYVLSKSFVVILIMVPLFTMHLLAQEKKSRTDQLLLTAPVSVFEVLFGKFLATAIVLLVPVIVSIGYPVYIAGRGEMSTQFLIGSYLAVILVCMVLLAIGMLVSSLTSNMVLAVVLAFGVYMIVILSRIIENYVPFEWLYKMFHSLSVYNIFYAMISGIVRSGDIIYLFMLVILFFSLTWLIVEKKRLGNTQFGIRLIVCLAVFGCVTGLGMHFTKVFDFTAEQLLTLSQDTKDTVSSISKKTDIYYLGERSRINATYEEFFEQYEKINDNIHVNYKNVQSDADFRNQYLATVGDVSETSLVVISGDKYVYLDANEYVSTVQTSQYSYKSTLELENQLTSAIYYVNSEDSQNIYYLTNHGESQLETGFSNMMRMNNYELRELNLEVKLNSVEQTIPESCKALLIIAPQTDFSNEEITALEDYMRDDGRIFVAIDPLNEDLTNFYQFLEKYGLKTESGVMVETVEDNYVYDTEYYLSPKIQSHEITKEIEKNHLAVLTMTSKGIYKNGSANGYQCTDLLTTSAKAYAKVFDFDNITTKGENDISGSFSVASLTEKENAGKMILLTSDIFFQDDVDSDCVGGNRQFFLSSMNYLTGTEGTGILIPGKEVGNQVALYPNQTQGLVKIMALVVLPVTVLLLGIIIFVGYRKNVIPNMKNRRKQKHEENKEQEEQKEQ